MLEMKRYRQGFAVAFCWFSLLAVLLPLSIAPFAYPYVLGWSILVFLSATARRLPLWLVAGLASAISIAVAATLAQVSLRLQPW